MGCNGLNVVDVSVRDEDMVLRDCFEEVNAHVERNIQALHLAAGCFSSHGMDMNPWLDVHDVCHDHLNVAFPNNGQLYKLQIKNWDYAN